ncbi:hypothetical protein BA184_07735 [Helicobacter pullorum]|uniref:hypothetical protein n=1 Tax=Helicobacter pullorum TaxID=35818 RepID=UPI000816AF6B|nr:hypothetical protein [Helicobacter pullorum]OCR03554.1 hypothetical protein BA729_06490 [Helicobacter pullorum]OCR06281.1 hypothetical protein BA185_07275 [Helicobacter pullorum]OCR08887.1 hypothetical protein BA184_07735 [Helicobacter pullorum]OCR12180.1 hypothetical protein BA730_06020 [Helicobacter pullorum]
MQYEQIREEINQKIQKRKEEDKQNQKIIKQIEVIQELEIKLLREKNKLEKLVNQEKKNAKENEASDKTSNEA